jgi:hypothetical protein
MNTTQVRAGMLNKTVRWIRAGYSPNAAQFGHIALVALCPAAGGDLRRSA